MPRTPTLARWLQLAVSTLAAVSSGVQAVAQTDADPTASPLELGSPFGDHMVLQRECHAAIWGWAAAGSEVLATGSWGGEGRAVAGPGGAFLLRLPTREAGGPHSVEIAAGEARVVLEDVLIGEVWLCSGQSNMEWPLDNTQGGAEAAAAANDSELRLLHVPRTTAATPQERCRGRWERATPESAADFSAVAYHFGARLRSELDVPVGLIGSYWGGTPCEAWTSAESLRRRGDFDGALDALRAQSEEVVDIATLRRRWWQTVEMLDKDLHGGADGSAAAVRTADWPVQAVPGRWEDGVLGAWDGVAWCVRDVEVPKGWVGADVTLQLGAIDDMDTVFWNGQRVGGHEEPGHWNRARSYTVPAELVTAGRARIAVRIVDTGGVGGIIGEAEAIRALQGEASIPLAGEWKLRQGPPMSKLGAFPSDRGVGPRHPTSLYNGMIAPLVPFSLRGFLWYQGEANRGQAWRYRTLLPEMIHDWRTRFGDRNTPFYLVQIAPYGYDGDTGEAAELREAQRLVLAMAGTGVAVTMDVGNPDDIHPRDKRPVGERLAALALTRDYGRAVSAEGPEYVGSRQEGRNLRLFFRNAEGLAVVDGGATLRVAGPDRVFHPARVEVQGATLLVSSEAVAQPVSVRHAWGAADAGCLVNGAGLPASSFRTDDWPAVTAR